MKHIRIYEEFYKEEDLQNLVDTLASVGLADKFRVECNLFIMVPMPGMHAFDWPEWAFRNIEVQINCQDDEEIILQKAFEEVLKGNFDVESNSYLDKMFLDAPELEEILSKEHMIEVAEKVNKIGPLDSRMHEKGKLYTLQEEFLLNEVLDLMESRAEEMIGEETPQGKFFGQSSEMKHLQDNIGWNIRIHKS